MRVATATVRVRRVATLTPADIRTILTALS